MGKRLLVAGLVSFSFLALFNCANPSSNTGGDSPGLQNTSKIPSDATDPYGRIINKDCPAGWKNVVPWFVAVHNDNIATTSKIEVDYLEAVAVVGGQEQVLVRDDYDVPWGGNGGLFLRSPWCAEYSKQALPASTANGILSFSPSDHKDLLWHVWNSGERPTLPASYSSIIVRAKVRITGGGCFELGCDWYLSADAIPQLNVTNKPLGVSDWYFASTAWQTVEISNR
jgi:hypothetical protein